MRKYLVPLLVLATAITSALIYGQSIVLGLSNIPTQWTGSLTQPQAITSSSQDVYKVRFEVYDTNHTTLLWYQDEFRTKLGPVGSKIIDQRWCLGGKKSTGFNATNERALTHTTRCNDFDTRILQDTSGSSTYRLKVIATKTDGSTVNYTKDFVVKNETKLKALSSVKWVASGGGGAGTFASPYASIAAGLSAATSGQTVIVKPGYYQEYNLTIPSGVSLLGYIGKTFIHGESQITSPTLASGTTYFFSPFTSLGFSAAGVSGSYGSPTAGGVGNCRDYTNQPCAANDLIESPIGYLTPVAYNATPANVQTPPTIPTGGFWVGNGGKLYVNIGRAIVGGDNFYYSLDRPSVLATSGSNVVRGLEFYGFSKASGVASGASAGHQFAPVNINGTGSIIEFNKFRNNRWSGIWIGGTSNQVRSNKIFDNWSIGYTGTPTSMTFESNEVYQNNNVTPYTGSSSYRHLWRAGFESGGGKTSGGVSAHNGYLYNYVHDNGGPGIWPDTQNEDTLIYRNRVYNNAWAGIDHELNITTNSWALIRENVAYENGFDYSWAGEDPGYLFDGTDERRGAYDPPDWNGGAGIIVRTSDKVDALYNLTAWNGDGGVAGVWEPSRVPLNGCPDYQFFQENVNIAHKHNIGDSNEYINSYVAEDGGACNQASFSATSTQGSFAKVRTLNNRLWAATTISGGATANPSNYVYSFGQNNGASTDDACFFLSNFTTFSSTAPVNCTFGTSTVSITQAERDTWLSDNGIPTSPISRPTSGPY